MALQDKFDQAFVQSILKKTLVSSNKVQAVGAANDNSYELTKSNLETLSNSFTSLQNTFNKIYAHTLNVRNLHRYQEKSIVNIKRENSLENKIVPSSSPVFGSVAGGGVSSSASILDSLASSVEKLNEKMKMVNLSGSGINPSLLDFGGAPSKPMKGGIGGLTDGPLNKRAMGGGVKANGTYLIGERGPEVLMMGGLSGKVIANGRRGRESQSEKYLMTAAERSSRAAATVIKGQPPGPTSYSSKFSNYLGSLFISMPNWLNGIKNWLGFGVPDLPGEMGQYGEGADLTENMSVLDAIAKAEGTYDTGYNTSLGYGKFLPGGKEMNLTGMTLRQLLGIGAHMRRQEGNPNSSALGRYQIVNNTMVDAAKALKMDLDTTKFDPATQDKMAMWILKNQGFKAWEGFKKHPELHASAQALYVSSRRAGVMSPSGMSLASPLPGFSVNSKFGMRNHPIHGDTRMHEGVDYSARMGTPVRSSGSGTVIFAGVRGGYGNTIEISHGGGLKTRYAHLSSFRVNEGDTVAQGQHIGAVGATGRVTGPHLHFEVLRNGKPQDPRLYIDAPTTMHANQVPPKLPAGYSSIPKTVPFTKGQKTQIVVIKTPSGYEIPRSAKGTADVPSYKGASGNGKREIEAYFRIGGTV